MKNLSAIMLALFLFVSVKAQPVNIHGRLKVDGTRMVDKKGNQLVLHGMSFGWSCFHPRFYTAGVVNTLVKDWHCTVVRAALGVEPAKGYKEDSAGQIKLIRNVVEAAIKNGIYVIIDWHSHNINLKEAKAFFATMATDYGKYPNVIYELLNEPDYETWAEVKAYATELIGTIRAIDKDNIILVGSPRWDQNIHLPANDPIKGFENLMYTMHFYAGTHKQWLRDRTDSAMQNGLPVFISECAGMEATGDGPIDYSEWQKWIDWMDNRKLSWIAWSVSDKNETCSILKPSAASEGGWKEEDIKESGMKTRAYLKNYVLKQGLF
jgi:endoglucanase